MNWYDYGAKMYDPAIGRFPSQDPLADEFSHASPILASRGLLIGTYGIAGGTAKSDCQL